MGETQQDKRWKKLMTRAQYGDEESYRFLLGEVYPVVRRFLISKLGAFGYDEDVTQECLLSLHRARHTYDPVRPFAPWMFAVVRYKAIDILRKNQRLAKKEVAESDFEETPDDRPRNAIPSEDLELVQKALGGLPDEMRRAVVLTKIEGMSTKDAAAVEDVSEAALRARVSRAYKALRKQLETDFDY